MIIYDENNYLDHFRDIKLFYKDYVGEPILNLILAYDKKKRWYPFEIFDLRFQVDHISPKKIRLFEEYDDNPANTIIYKILILHTEYEMISDGNKIISV